MPNSRELSEFADIGYESGTLERLQSRPAFGGKTLSEADFLSRRHLPSFRGSVLGLGVDFAQRQVV